MSCVTTGESGLNLVSWASQVNLVSEHIWCEDFLVRSFYLKNLQTNETRTVTQFHFLSWTDRGIPDSARTLLDFRRYCAPALAVLRTAGPTPGCARFWGRSRLGFRTFLVLGSCGEDLVSALGVLNVLEEQLALRTRF